MTLMLISCNLNIIKQINQSTLSVHTADAFTIEHAHARTSTSWHALGIARMMYILQLGETSGEWSHGHQDISADGKGQRLIVHHVFGSSTEFLIALDDLQVTHCLQVAPLYKYQ